MCHEGDTLIPSFDRDQLETKKSVTDPVKKWQPNLLNAITSALGDTDTHDMDDSLVEDCIVILNATE